MHTHTKTALTNENDERELWPQHDHEIVYGVFLTFSSLSLPRTLLLWHQISCLSTVSIKIQHQYAPKWIESELINLNWAIGCITATATAVSRPFTAITLQRVHASAKKCIFWLCDNTQILEFTKGKKPHLILMCCQFFCSNCRFKRSFGEAHYRSSDMVYIQNIVCASFRISRASYCWCLSLVFFCCCLMFFFVNFVVVLSVVSSNVRVSIEQMYGFLTLLRMRIWMCVWVCVRFVTPLLPSLLPLLLSITQVQSPIHNEYTL